MAGTNTRRAAGNELLSAHSFAATLRSTHERNATACQGSVVKRALKYAVVVGVVLIMINHSDAILQGQVTRGRFFKMALTVLVPYIVSTLSSVGAMRERRTEQVGEA